MKMYRLILGALFSLSSLFSFAQDFLGTVEFPNPNSNVPLPPSFGTDFTGGYQVGEMASNFQIYNPEGESIRLSNVLENGKYTIVSSGSASCVRFFEAFNTANSWPDNQAFFEFGIEHQDDFNWLFVYGFEAHPGDLENCTSNCPALTIPAPNGDTLFQHQFYQDRLNALTLWKSILEEDTLTFDMPFNMYADSPDNQVYKNFFERPFGCVVLDCTGEVIARGDWTATWIAGGGDEFLNGLLDSGPCVGEPYSCEGDAEDTDEDGICDDQELWQGWDPNNPNSPEISTSIVHSELTEFAAFPNPFNNVLKLSNAATGDQIQIWDMQGRLAHSTRLQSPSAINLSILDQGVYTLILLAKSGEMRSQLIVKR